MKTEGPVQRTARPRTWVAGLAALAALTAPVMAAQIPVAQARDVATSSSSTLAVSSEWRNPSNSVHIRITPCGQDRKCGKVIWASDKAKADARKGGTTQLVGSNLLRDVRPSESGQYKARVFVPDLNQSFSGQVRVNGDQLIGKGCVLGIICKSQTWTRIS